MQEYTRLYQEHKYEEALQVLSKLHKFFIENGKENDIKFSTILEKIALIYLVEKGGYDEAESLFLKSWEIRDKILGMEHPDTVEILYNLSRLYRVKGDLSLAEVILLRINDIYKMGLPDHNHLNFANVANDLGMVYQKMGAYVKAEEYFGNASDIYRTNGMENDLFYATLVNNLALLYLDKRDYDKSEEHFQKALNIYRTLGKENYSLFALTLNSLGRVYHQKYDYIKAKEYYREALELKERIIGKNHPQYAENLNDLGSVYLDESSYAEAEQCYQEAQEYWHDMQGENHPGYVESLKGLGMIYHYRGNYAKAKDYYQKALDTLRRIGLERSIEYSIILNDVGTLYRDKLNLNKAEKYVIKALDIIWRIAGENHPQYAVHLSNLAAIYYDKAQYTRQEKLLLKSLDIIRRTVGENSSECVKILHALGEAYFHKGKHGIAEKYFLQALDIIHRTIGGNHPEYASVLHAIGKVYFERGQNKKARNYYLRSLDVVSKKFGKNNLDYALPLVSLSSTYFDTGEYAKGEKHYLEALDIIRSTVGKNSLYYSELLINRGMLYHMIGDIARAEEYYLEALDIIPKTVGENHPMYALLLNAIGRIFEHRSDLDKAEENYLKALKALSLIPPEERQSHSARLSLATTLDNLAPFYHIKGDLVTAEQTYLNALQIWNGLGKDQQYKIRSLKGLGIICQDKREYSKAEEYYQQAVKISREAAIGDSQSLIMLAGLNINNDKIKEALDLFVEAIKVEDRGIGNIFSIASDEQRMAYIERIIRHFYQFISFVIRYYPQSQKAIRTAVDLVIRRKGIGLEVLVRQRDALLSDKYPQLQGKLDELNSIRKKIVQKESLVLNNVMPDHLASLKFSLKELYFKKGALEALLSRNIPETKLQQILQSARIKGVSRLVPKETTLIEFICIPLYKFKPTRNESHWSALHYLAFILHSNKSDSKIHVINLGSAEEINLLINGFRKSIMKKQGSFEIRKYGSELRKLVFDPLLNFMPDHTNLFLAPDGELTRLPFEALPYEDGSTYLIDKYCIRYLNTSRDLILDSSEGKKEMQEAPMVIADPDFDLDITKLKVKNYRSSSESYITKSSNLGIGHFKPLRKTRMEGTIIGKILGVEPLMQEHALESKLKACRSPRILHIATHGFFIGEQPEASQIREINNISQSLEKRGDVGNLLLLQKLENPLMRSGLALAGSNCRLKGMTIPENTEDGILFAQEMVALDLTNTELVVLSACGTGLGEIRKGEGVFGLRRSIAIAGARTLVMSLWKVPDKQTAKLMVEFYRELSEGHERCQALRKARLMMKEKYPHNPYYWGAFICQGNSGTLAIKP